MRRCEIFIISILFALTLLPGLVFAGKQCTEYVPDVEAFYNASKMALKLEQELKSRNVHLALVGREGGDLSKYGLKYTHMAYILKKQSPDGERWTFIHELNECNSDYSSIYDQGMVNFFLDDLVNMNIVVLIPDTALQEKLIKTLNHPKINHYHNKNYSMIANPFSLKYQNSNQWVMEILAASQGSPVVINRKDAQVFIQQHNFQPQWIKISPLKRLGASMFSVNVRFDDHSREEKNNNRFKTVSVKSIVNYLLSQGGSEQIFEISEQGKVVEF